MLTNILLEKPLNINLLDELKKNFLYISNNINDFNFNITDDKITSIDVEVSNNCSITELKKNILNFIDLNIRNKFIINPKIIWENNIIAKFKLNIFDELIDNKLILKMGDGQMAINKDLLLLMNYFDSKILEIAVTKFNAQEYLYPTLISKDTLEKCGSFETFPHFIMIVTRLHNEFQNYKNFKNQLKYNYKETLNNNLIDYCNNTDFCLPPTMCYYTYQQYSNTKLKDNITITSKGKAFRYENKYCSKLERLWDFTIREIVFLGSTEYVLKCRKNFMTKSFEFMKNIGLMCHCETANDPFFFDENANNKTFFQQHLQTKFELRGNIEKNRTISIASFNYHQTFFSRNFNIKFNNNKHIETGCVGFGLERLLYVFLCQFGYKKENWPLEIRSYIENKSHNI